MMLFFLKKELMRIAINRRNARNPFDYQRAENFSLEGSESPLVNNSYYFSAHGESLSVFARLGKRTSMDETWFAVFKDGKIYSLKREFFPAGESPLKVEKKDGVWTIEYNGVLNEADSVSFRGRFVSDRAPIDFTSDMPSERMATAMANEKWSKDFFKELQSISGQCHYEQEGVLEGEMTLSGKSLNFSLPCVRDHSFGKRDWNYMNNHLWLMAVSPELQMNYSLVSYPAMSVLEVGNFRDGSGQHFLREAKLDFQQINKGTIPQELSFELSLDDGRTIPVEAKVLGCVSYHFQDGEYILHENIAEYNIGGKSCRGILEIGFNRDGSRFFNHRDLTTFKR